VRDGPNTIQFFSGQAGESVVVSNVDVILIGSQGAVIAAVAAPGDFVQQ